MNVYCTLESKAGANIKLTPHQILRRSYVIATVLMLLTVAPQSQALENLKEMVRYKTTDLRSAYIGENDGSTEAGQRAISVRGKPILYLESSQDREPFRVEIKDGIVFTSGRNKTSARIEAKSKDATDTEDAIYEMTDSKINYVMDSAGNFYFFENERKANANIRHSSMFAGKPVAGAGEMILDKKTGKILSVNSHSGHYAPKEQFFANVMKELKSLGVSDTAFNN